MKKIILAAAIVLTTGILSNNVKSVKVIKAPVAFDKNVTATAD
jgi:hypothetical protein